jgi:hypothetical protein
MIIKCADYLPKRDGIYDTDLGKLEFIIHDYYNVTKEKVISRWYTITQVYNCKSYKPVQPLWWTQIDK